MLVSAADKLHNFRTICDDVRRAGPPGDAVFARFKGKKFGTLWYYRALADLYATVSGRHDLIAAELSRLVDAATHGQPGGALLAAHLHG